LSCGESCWLFSDAISALSLLDSSSKAFFSFVSKIIFQFYTPVGLVRKNKGTALTIPYFGKTEVTSSVKYSSRNGLVDQKILEQV